MVCYGFVVQKVANVSKKPNALNFNVEDWAKEEATRNRWLVEGAAETSVTLRPKLHYNADNSTFSVSVIKMLGTDSFRKLE